MEGRAAALARREGYCSTVGRIPQVTFLCCAAS